jgi:hypothetical protein
VRSHRAKYWPAFFACGHGGRGAGLRKSDRLAHGAYTRGHSLEANRDIHRNSGGARSGMCRRHLHRTPRGHPAETTLPSRLATPLPRRCATRSCKTSCSRSGRQLRRQRARLRGAAHDAKRAWEYRPRMDSGAQAKASRALGGKTDQVRRLAQSSRLNGGLTPPTLGLPSALDAPGVVAPGVKHSKHAIRPTKAQA